MKTCRTPAIYLTPLTSDLQKRALGPHLHTRQQGPIRSLAGAKRCEPQKKDLTASIIVSGSSCVKSATYPKTEIRSSTDDINEVEMASVIDKKRSSDASGRSACAGKSTRYNVQNLMHELPITESLLKIALRHAGQAGAKRITQLNIVVGELSSIVGESVQFYWDIISKDTIAEGAELHFERVEGTLHCLVCGHTFPLNREDFTCPACGGKQVVAVGGDELRLDSIEIE